MTDIRQEPTAQSTPASTAMDAVRPNTNPVVASRRPEHAQHARQRNDGVVAPIITAESLDIFYGSFHAVRGASMSIGRNQITAMIGPSGCGKSTVLRCFNRMNDLIPTARVEGTVMYHGQDLYGPGVDPTEVRRRIGMVFQKPNPFPKSIYENVAYGPKVTGMKLKKSNLDLLVEEALQRSALWDEVKDKLNESGLSLSGGQQQRLCIARAIATKPDVVLMDEPCSALDPIATMRIEDLMQELVNDYTIIIVTHNMQQAARVSDRTAFFTANVDEQGQRYGQLVEFDSTTQIFTKPSDSRTEDYVSGRFG